MNNDLNILSPSFLAQYKNKQPNWGFNGLGYIVYKRTYARLKEDGTTEEWRCYSKTTAMFMAYNSTVNLVLMLVHKNMSTILNLESLVLMFDHFTLRSQ